MIRVLSLLFSAVFGGPHNRNSRIAPLLAQRGVQFVVAIPDEPGNALERLRGAGLEVVQVPTHRLRKTLRPSAHLSFAAGFWRDVGIIRTIICERQIDALLVNGVMHPHGAIAGRREGIPVVWQIIEDPPAALKYALTPLITRYSDVVMTTGMTLVASYPGMKRLGERLISFLPPVDLAVFRPDAEHKAAARRELGLPADGLVIGNVGNLNRDKDHRNFIRAAAALKGRHPDAKFVILGSSYEERAAYLESLWREAETLGLGMGRDLVVRNPGNAVARLAQAFDVFWLTSRSEGVPAVLGEAMALALPIVATDVGSVREVLLESKAGLVVPARSPEAIVDATLPLVDDPELRWSFGQSGRRFAHERFDLRICADLHWRAFEMALARHHRSQSSGPAPGRSSAIK